MSYPLEDNPDGYEWEVAVTNRALGFAYEPVRVRAWDLPDALCKAAELPLSQFVPGDDER